ncbi:MAG TPA: phosphotransferase family protein [Caulobacteraceae bacterium]|nr:phosphotransferase family protein [Caulobacteraceae bacterium]
MEALIEPLTRLAQRKLGGDAIAGLTRLSAGATQEIWRFGVFRGDVETPVILRRAPGGTRVSETAIGLATEAGLIEAAGRVGVPVPPVLCVLEEEDGLGQGFVMGFVEGETLGGRIARSEALAGARPGLARQCGEILARIHTLDPGEFPNLRRATPAELVAQYRASYEASQWPRPVLDLTFRWLETHCPPAPERPRLVHGDFRNGNLMIGPDGVRAVLDWEIAHVADPMEDLGWICVNAWRFGVLDKPVGGFGDREELWAGYEAAGGDPVNRAHAHWWEVYGSMRWGVMCVGMTAAFRSADPSVERAVIARRVSENELDLMRLIAA